jgi:hypothetical protein
MPHQFLMTLSFKHQGKVTRDPWPRRWQEPRGPHWPGRLDECRRSQHSHGWASREIAPERFGDSASNHVRLSNRVAGPRVELSGMDA